MFDRRLPIRNPIRPDSFTFWILALAAIVLLYEICHYFKS